MTSRSYESGIQPYRIEFIRESTRGVTPDDPTWVLFSDNVRTFEPAIDPQMEGQEGLGTPDYNSSFAGTEQTEITVVYDLQQWLIDGSSNAQDASYDAVARNNDNRIPNSHSVVRRLDVGSLDAGNTINGATSKDSRMYFVGKGGLADVTFTMNIDSGQPIQVELAYQFEKGRLYQIDQPPSDGSGKQIALQTDADDTNDQGTTITIEGIDDGGNAAEEDVSLDGADSTTAVDTDTAFQEIDAIEIGSELVNNLEVYEDDDNTNDSVTLGDQLAVFYGQKAYDQGEGDLGVPALGSGSHASALGGDYELPLDGDLFELPTGTTIADEITTTEISFDNNINAMSRSNGPRPRLVEGGRDAEVSTTVFGQVETYQQTVDMLRTNAQNYKWTASDPNGDSGSVELTNTKVTEVGESEEARQDVIEVELTVAQQEGVTIA